MLAPGFPKKIELSDRTIVDADPLLVHAAAFLDSMPPGERVSTQELADGVRVSLWRAEQMLIQLHALGHVSASGAHGDRFIFDPDGLTVPAPD